MSQRRRFLQTAGAGLLGGLAANSPAAGWSTGCVTRANAAEPASVHGNRPGGDVSRSPAIAEVSATAEPAEVPPTANRAPRPQVEPPVIACQQYPWHTLYGRLGRDANAERAAVVADLQAAGMLAFEGLIGSRADVDDWAALLAGTGIRMPSLYVNSTLHDMDSSANSLREVEEIARRARERLGSSIIVTNPSPLQWGGQQAKSDAQLEHQADSLNELGRRLQAVGCQLAYHNHDIELRYAARELHHMLAGTDPSLVKFCLDAHWVYRGAGNSAVALFDIVKLYGSRVIELHLRQSQGGVWTEAFGPGDIDYARLARDLTAQGCWPHLVLEQAVEAGTDHQLSPVAAHQQSGAFASEVFADWLVQVPAARRAG